MHKLIRKMRNRKYAFASVFTFLLTLLFYSITYVSVTSEKKHLNKKLNDYFNIGKNPSYNDTKEIRMK